MSEKVRSSAADADFGDDPEIETGSDEPLMRPRKPLPAAELDITPMIDVTFLLLIFFMVTSTMQTAPDVDVPVARHGVGVETKSAAAINVRLDPSTNPPSPYIELKAGKRATIDDVRTFVEERVRRKQRSFVVKAERRVPHGFVQQVTRAIVESEGVNFFIAVSDETQ